MLALQSLQNVRWYVCVRARVCVSLAHFVLAAYSVLRLSHLGIGSNAGLFSFWCA